MGINFPVVAACEEDGLQFGFRITKVLHRLATALVEGKRETKPLISVDGGIDP
jgi:hypothetical protein